MRKVAITMVIFILFLSSGFANFYYDYMIKPLVKQYMPEATAVMVVAGLGRAFEECPNLVAEVVKEKNISLDLGEAQKNSGRIYRALGQLRLRAQNEEKEIVRSIVESVDLKIGKKCDSLGLSVKGYDSDKAKCIETSADKFDEIECLLRAYSPKLVSQAEWLLVRIKKELGLKEEL